jgi:hypothetical protein
MRRRWVLALVLVTALVFTGVGAAVDRWVVPEKGTSAECIILRSQISEFRWVGEGKGDSSASEVVEMYDEECR